ncbi:MULTISPECIES: Arc family DNA-binding protein [Streptomyces]|uniref:Arc family DNA-binding protein n=1 Tax=Streptomyces mirabilis TaxID=68239 RepID=A0ABU3UIH3_9ACTN|nr:MULTISPECIES: Arc family DNA-binding protein [Streptomyces]MCX4612588.1 Arc family DNA-binding protein [Streptomyces mirabilis]MCX5352811.1 Arc family DNA-binding protein [Streptomyces mirabilis]MDU8993707.1 Arc family DNA-binding protein [Streptomyces mirabilis]QDN90891.1 Arc family DNA-binding protein [Streptomyces sp. RLB3-6]QDO11720.1 Arc family DNA-binding protein [Streptomyces sp. S1D4-23]
MIRFSLRIPEDLHKRVVARAATDRRSLNSEILHLIEVALNAAATDAGSPGGDPASPAPQHGNPDSPLPEGRGTFRDLP